MGLYARLHYAELMLRVDDEQENATWVYAYDMGGNILSKKKVALGVIDGEPLESKVFTYGNTNWKDQLTAVNDVPITYDAIGNPLNDGEWTYTWQNGRQLARMQKDGVDASFVYNENGLRVQKTVNGVVTNYTLHGKNIVHMTEGTDELHFFYDAKGKPAVVVYNGTPYSYVKNLQGDIVAILDATGNVVVSYVYDAWGRLISTTGDMADTLGTVNPFRYRAYCYDRETGLYYLRSRYYNLFEGRFINADTLINTTPSCLSGNQYCYCCNHPVVSIDSDGYLHLSGPHNEVQKDYASFLMSGGSVVTVRTEVGFFKWGDTGTIGRADIVNFSTGEVWEIKPCSITFLRDPLRYCSYTLDQLNSYLTGTIRNDLFRGMLGDKELCPGEAVFLRGPIPYGDDEEIIYWSNGDGIIWYWVYKKNVDNNKRTQRHTELRAKTNYSWLAYTAGALCATLLFGGGGGKARVKAFDAQWAIE